jgi:ubiquitin-protein ligase E3 C
MDFTGSISKPRNISFANTTNKKSTTTTNLTQTVREERERRAVEKRRNQAAITIQAAFRSSFRRYQSRIEYQNIARKKLSDVTKLSLVVRQFIVPTPIIRPLTREFVFAFSGNNNNSLQLGELNTLINLIQQGNSFKPISYEDNLPFAISLSELARLCIRANHLEGAHLLLTSPHLTSTSCADITRSRVVKYLVNNLLQTDVSNNQTAIEKADLLALCIESTAVIASSSNSNNQSTSYEAYVTLYTCLEQITNSSLATIIVHSLLTKCSTNTHLTLYNSVFVVHQQLQQQNNNTNSTSTTTTTNTNKKKRLTLPTTTSINSFQLWILANLYFSSPLLNNHLQATTLFIRSAQLLVDQIHGVSYICENKQHIVTLISNSSSNTVTTTITTASNHNNNDNENLFIIGSFLWSVVSRYTANNNTVIGRNTNSNSSLPIRSQVLLALMTRQRTSYNNETSLIDILWSALHGNVSRYCTSHQFKSTTSPNNTTLTNWYFTLCVTSMATSLLVQSLDDVELFQKRRPFGCVMLAVETLKLILYDTAWVHDQDPQPELVSLFSQLYARFSRAVATMGNEFFITTTTSTSNTTNNNNNNISSLFQFPTLPPPELGVELPSSSTHANLGFMGRSAPPTTNSSSSSTSMDETLPVLTRTTSTRARRILRGFSFVVPFSTRVQLFHQLLQKKKIENGSDDETQGLIWNPLTNSFELSQRQTARVRRSHVVYDAFGQLRDADFTKRVRVSFVNDLGLEEAGIDGGGLWKEFLVSFVGQAMDIKFGLFTENASHQLYPRKGADVHLLRMVGKVIGKAVYDGVLLQPTLAPHVLNLLCGTPNTVHDLTSLDPSLYTNLMALKDIPANTLEAMELTFSINSNGGSMDVDLVPHGSNILVTKENLNQYFVAFADYRLNVENSRETDAFIEGFMEIIDQNWVHIFDAMELNSLIGGSLQPDFDVMELRRYTHYGGGYLAQQPYIQAFWEVVQNLTPQQRGELLKFVTSCSRPPLTGFQALQPPFTIHFVNDSTRLPTSSTCVNLLKLPQYESVTVLKEKLIMAIESHSGFELS